MSVGLKGIFVWVVGLNRIVNINYINWNFLLRQHNISEYTRIDCSYLKTRINFVVVLIVSVVIVGVFIELHEQEIQFKSMRRGENAGGNLMRKLIR